MEADLRRDALELPSWTLTLRQLCDFELLANGGFAPLSGFMRRADYDRVLADMHLADGALWPIPVTLGVSNSVADQATASGRLALRDSEGTILGVLHVEDAWEPDIAAEAEAVYATANREHAGVAALFEEPSGRYLGGRVEVVALPEHFDFREHRHTPAELRAEFARRGWTKVVAFQTRNPMHRAHYELTVRAASPLSPLPAGEGASPPSPLPPGEGGDGLKLLIHPSVGATKAGDVDHYTRVRCYRALLPRYPKGSAMLSLLPLAMRLAGPREALWHAIIRRNYGCTHFIVGRDHAGPGADAAGKPFYGPYDAHELVRRFKGDLGIEVVCARDLVYMPEAGGYVPDDQVPSGAKTLSLSGTEFRRRLETGEEIPEWLSFPEVLAELRGRKTGGWAVGRLGGRDLGCVVFFTGLPASGKSTLARAVAARLLEDGRGPVTVLDADEVRRKHWPELGFTKEDRDENIRRLGQMAADRAAEGGVVLCAAIAPYDAVRKEVRHAAERVGIFLLVHVATPLAVCEARDPKGLYAKARAGAVKAFTGVSDPYEPPSDAELVIAASEADSPPGVMAGLVIRSMQHGVS